MIYKFIFDNYLKFFSLDNLFIFYESKIKL